MTPTQLSGGINIDQMLQSLSSQAAAPSTVTPTVISNPLVTSFSVESIIKPISATVSSDVSVSDQVVQSQSSSTQSIGRLSSIPHRVRTSASVVATILVIVLGIRVVSIKYPLETQEYNNKIFGVVDSVVATTENNMNTTNILVETAMNISEDNTHSAAPENYIIQTPLADAMAQAQELQAQDTPNDIALGIAAGQTGTTMDTGTTSTVVPLSLRADFDLPATGTVLTVAELSTQLINLSESAQQAMVNLVGNSENTMSQMNIVYKRSQGLLRKLSDSTYVPDDAFRQEVMVLKNFYASSVSQ